MQKNKLFGFDKIKEMILHNGDEEIFVKPRTREDFEKEMVQGFDSKNEQTDPNMILAKDVYMSMDRIKTHRNPSIFVVGGTEEDRMNCIVKPNVMQENASFVISDPTGELFHMLALPLLNNGYKLKIFSTLRPLNAYNPLDYLYNEEGKADRKRIKLFVEALARGVEENASIDDPFWDETVKRWIFFTTYLLLEWYPKVERNLYNLLNLTKQGMNSTNEIKRIIDDLYTNHKETLETSKAWYYYNLFNNAPEKTRLAAIISIYTSLLLPFESIDQIKDLTTTRYIHDKNNNLVFDENNEPIPDDNNLNIEKLGNQKTVLFINAESTDKSYNFLVTLLYNHIFTVPMRESFFYKDQYVIRDIFKEVVKSGFKTKEAAEHRLELFKSATVISRDNKTAHGTITEYYIYNKDAEDTEIPRDLYYADAEYNKGILMRPAMKSQA